MSDIAFPTLTRSAPPELTWGLALNTQYFESPLSRYRQTTGQPGSRWRAVFSFLSLAEADAVALQAWLLKICEGDNRALIRNYARLNPRGTIAGQSPLVNGAIAAGATSAILDAAGASKTFLAGDFFSVSNHFLMVTDDATADGSGNITVNFRPRTRAIIADNAALTLASPTVRMMWEDTGALEWLSRPAVVTDFQLSFIEVPA